jgi:hypothetical protein
MQAYARRHPDVAEYIDITHALCHDAASPCDDRVDGVRARPDCHHVGINTVASRFDYRRSTPTFRPDDR